MANKKKQLKHQQEASESSEKNTSDYYKLNSDAVDRLINANESNSPVVTEKEIKTVSGRRRFHLPYWLTAIIIKWWFPGAACFFFFFGLGTYLEYYDLLFVLGAALGAIIDLFVNNALRFFEVAEGQSKNYMLVEYKKFWTLFLNIAYGYVILYIVIYLYSLISLAIVAIGGEDAASTFGVEPLLFGTLVLIVDFVFIGIKNLIKKIISDAKKTAGAAPERKQ